jgi:hypothetical protein
MADEVRSFFLEPPVLYVVLALLGIFVILVLTAVFRCIYYTGRTFGLCCCSCEKKKLYPLPNVVVGTTSSSSTSSDRHPERLIRTSR